MLNGEDILDAANLMIGLYGDGARAEARARIESHRVQSDAQGEAEWKLIGKEIDHQLAGRCLTGEWG
jgi:hypothetical protein